MNSQALGRCSSTIVTVTNQSTRPNLVTVSWFVGFSDNSSPVGSSSFIIPPDFTVDFGSRNLPSELTVVNSVPNPELVFDEGRAIVSSRRPEIGVSARSYYEAHAGARRRKAELSRPNGWRSVRMMDSRHRPSTERQACRVAAETSGASRS